MKKSYVVDVELKEEEMVEAILSYLKTHFGTVGCASNVTFGQEPSKVEMSKDGNNVKVIPGKYTCYIKDARRTEVDY